jgi:hypothetical protein
MVRLRVALIGSFDMTYYKHCDDLAHRFEKMSSEGLLDVKFFLDTSDEATQSVVCAEVNLLFAAIDASEHYALDFRDASHA